MVLSWRERRGRREVVRFWEGIEASSREWGSQVPMGLDDFNASGRRESGWHFEEEVGAEEEED
jgi:hypothetical protein